MKESRTPAKKRIDEDRSSSAKSSLYRSAFSLAWPAALEGALLSIIGSVDTMMVQVVDPSAIAAVNLASQPRMILLILSQALCVGVTALVARRKGENDREGAGSVLSQSMVLMTDVSILVSILGYFLAVPLVDLAGANTDTREMAADYLRVISLGLLFNGWNLCLCAALRAVGNTRITMVTNVTANVVNVVLNWCLIGGNLGFPKLGVKGAALATVIGTAVACTVTFGVIIRKKSYLKLRLKGLHFDRRTLNGLFRVGLSSAAESVCLRIGFFVNNRMIADIGTDALTAYAIVQQVTSLSFVVGDGIATAGATLVGQALGAENKQRAKDTVKCCRVLSLFASFALMGIIFLLRNDLAGLFTQDERIIAGASLAFIVTVLGMPPQNARVVYSGCLRGAGDTRYVALCSLLSVSILRPALTWLFCFPLRDVLPGLQTPYTGPWIAFLLDAVVRQLLLFDRVRKGKFLNIRL